MKPIKIHIKDSEGPIRGWLMEIGNEQIINYGMLTYTGQIINQSYGLVILDSGSMQYFKLSDIEVNMIDFKRSLK